VPGLVLVRDLWYMCIQNYKFPKFVCSMRKSGYYSREIFQHAREEVMVGIVHCSVLFAHSSVKYEGLSVDSRGDLGGKGWQLGDLRALEKHVACGSAICNLQHRQRRLVGASHGTANGHGLDQRVHVKEGCR
jgi:hypothetical protein